MLIVSKKSSVNYKILLFQCLQKKTTKHNINIKSAYLRLFTDIMASVAVLMGGILMKCFQIYWVDSVLTFIIGLDLLKKSTKMLMLFTPSNIDIKELVREVYKFLA